MPLNPANAQDGITLGGFYVDTDTWNVAELSVSQTLYVCDYNNWYVVAKMDNTSGDGAVKTYPNVHQDFNASPAINSFSAISSSFAHAGPQVGIYEFAYDIWLNGVASNGSTEVMIWTDNFNQVPSGSVQETVTFERPELQGLQERQLHRLRRDDQRDVGDRSTCSTSSTTSSPRAGIPPTSTLSAVDYGVELVSTNGMNATFTVSDFSLTTM